MTTATVKTPVRRKRIRPQKSLNGQAKGGTYLLTFNLDNAGETRAWEMAQNLAGQRKLKQVLTGMLLAIRTVEEHTGKPIDMTHFMAQFVTQLVLGGKTGGYAPLPPIPQPEELPSMFAGTEDRADPLQARQAFAGGMGNLFGDDDEDEWD